MFTPSVSFPAAFLAGLISFASPCILPLIPAYFSFITGYSLDELTESDPKEIRAKVVLSTSAFVLGFSIVFILLGASASFLGGLINQHKEIFRIAGGVIVIILGLHISGLLRLNFLNVEKRMHLDRKPVHFLGTLFVGMAFGAGWSPCIGPMLAGILAIAATQETVLKGVLLLTVYSAGLAIPFLILSLFVHMILNFVRRGAAYLKYVNVTAGVLLVIMGLLLITDKLAIIV